MELKITKKPFSISTNGRILYRIVLLLLIMYYTGRGQKKAVALLKIHLLVWAMQTIERQKLLLLSKENNYVTSVGIWNIDNNTNQALTYMYEDGLCNIKKKNYGLTDEGKKLVKKIIEDQEVFKDEKEFLHTIGSSLGENKVNKLQDLWIS